MNSPSDVAELLAFIEQLSDPGAASSSLAMRGGDDRLRVALNRLGAQVQLDRELREVERAAQNANTRRLADLTEELLNTQGEKQQLAASNDRLMRLSRELEQAQSTLLKQADELQRSNREFSDFADSMAHDLRAPLRHVQAYVGMVVDGHGSDLDEEGKRMLGVAVGAARRMRQLLDGLLDYARLGGDLQLESVDVHAVVTQVVADLGALIDEKHARVHIGILPVVQADRNSVYQALLNLVSNALKYSRPDVPPEIDIYGDPMRDESDADGLLSIHVRDNGVGIPEESLSQVFSPFKRLVGSGAVEGAGLGLGIVSKVVRRLGGAVSASSTAGDGSTFTLRLPVATAPLERSGGRSSPPPPRSSGTAPAAQFDALDGFTVLVVDDDPAERDLSARHLRAHGARVVTADSAAAALQAMESINFSVVVSDLEMPGADGRWLLQRIRESHGSRRVLVSSRSLTDVHGGEPRAGEEQPWEAFFTKPLMAPQLADFLRAAPAAGPSAIVVASPTEGGPRSVTRKAPRVLLVDDDPMDAFLTEQVLVAHGYQVAVVGTVEQVRQHLERELPGLLITDLSLPGTDGVALCEQLRASHPDLPLAVQTGLWPSGVQERLRALGVTALPLKGADAAEFVEAVRKALPAAMAAAG